MNRITSTLALSLTAATLLATPAFARDAQDAAFGNNDKPIGDSWGKCVRTKWQGENDPCRVDQVAKEAPKPAPVAPAPRPVISQEERTVYFDFDSAKLTPEATTKLDSLSNVINQSQAITEVRIVGFTDQFGTNDYNLKLSQKRVQSVVNYLNQRTRLQAQAADIRGLGKSAPDASCQGLTKREEKIACMRTERRVEAEFTYQK